MDCFFPWTEGAVMNTDVGMEKKPLSPGVFPDAGMFPLNRLDLGRGSASWVLMVYYETMKSPCDGSSAHAPRKRTPRAPGAAVASAPRPRAAHPGGFVAGPEGPASWRGQHVVLIHDLLLVSCVFRRSKHPSSTPKKDDRGREHPPTRR